MIVVAGVLSFFIPDGSEDETTQTDFWRKIVIFLAVVAVLPLSMGFRHLRQKISLGLAVARQEASTIWLEVTVLAKQPHPCMNFPTKQHLTYFVSFE